ncbi:MarR family transcriptional regulator [Streptomyces sp. SID3343]|uniref:MarR family winged helix-turn-helix transcriptional regulator n=1 Tax=Streptomyces sp. SID3343 TaxID=2690260 RepID=UPI00136F4A17|nr:MarR family transcriptional regulator [Streptomyces sp. SID3343]MYW06352.1 MarR family transcriptional regulator [Streptomyces sp. SID3343]
MNGNQRLTATERDVWRAHLAGTMELAAHLDRRMRREAGMQLTYFEILSVLSEAPGRQLRMTELATVSQSSTSRLSHAVNVMEKSGWVIRRPAACDRRGWIAELTDEGRAALAAALPVHASIVQQHLFGVLTPDQVIALGRIGAAIRAGLAGECAAARAEEDAGAAADADDVQSATGATDAESAESADDVEDAGIC